VAGLDLTSAEGFARGGQSGPVVSKLVGVTSYDEALKMPPTAS